MKIPLSYIVRNLWTRKLTTALTAGGMALVVFVFATVLMLEEGLRSTLVQTGAADNAVVIRRSSVTEVQSAVDRNQAAIATSAPEVAYGADGEPMVSKEVVVLINLDKRGSRKPSNMVIRSRLWTRCERRDLGPIKQPLGSDLTRNGQEEAGGSGLVVMRITLN